jgi:hypothetical protein
LPKRFPIWPKAFEIWQLLAHINPEKFLARSNLIMLGMGDLLSPTDFSQRFYTGLSAGGFLQDLY